MTESEDSRHESVCHTNTIARNQTTMADEVHMAAAMQ